MSTYFIFDGHDNIDSFNYDGKIWLDNLRVVRVELNILFVVKNISIYL